ncbi:MAG TPA: L-histidine N(alpha)-methyltransferase [Allosphingosinicella sp.]|nr:L-histidine N(alpha)-methyltransferase [Allosphingosinicella sp.]
MDAPANSIEADPAFLEDVLAGLSAPIPAVPARWLYDRRGSELFEKITELPEYYLTRTETALLHRYSRSVAELAGRGSAIVEFGSGSSAKTPILIDAVEPAAYVPIDISGEFLKASVAELKSQLPLLPIYPVEADFMKPLELPQQVARLPKLGFFPGSTIGNMVARTAVDLLRAMKETLGQGAFLLVGMDRIKDEEELLRAYDDTEGVTAEFNLNLLHRINAELGGTIPVHAFRHRAVWNDRFARVEMHLEALNDVEFTVADRRFAFGRGESIHTENSHKYGPRDARLLLHAAGWGLVKEWTDPEDRFALLLVQAEPPRQAP